MTSARRHWEFLLGALDQAGGLVEFVAFDHAVQQCGHRTLWMTMPAPVHAVNRSLCVGRRFGDPAAGVEDECPHIRRLHVCEQRAALAGVTHRRIGGILRLDRVGPHKVRPARQD